MGVPFLFLRQSVVANVKVRNLLTIPGNYFHQIGQLTTVDVDACEIELLQVRQLEYHCFEALHQDVLVDLNVSEAQSCQSTSRLR